ncbi:MAG: beta-glucosidase [Bifidobacteriaceae bacterium]|jgi:beta-N-acetylhexosaminidase|nr:beta-glucosidase [Bifidobacteriaceae bacterium]
MTRHRASAALLAAGLALGLGACGQAESPAPATATLTATPPAAAKTAPPVPLSTAAASDWVERSLAAMTLEQKAGQLVMATATAQTGTSAAAQAVADHHLGSVLLLGGGWGSAAEVKRAADALQAKNDAVAGLWIAVDQEGGRVQRLDGSGFDTIPSALDQGQLSAQELESRALAWGEQLAAAGVNLNLAPVVDTVAAADRAANAPIGALDRDFGLDADGNAAHAAAFARGMAQAGVGAALKHFPGLGRLSGNTDFTAQGITDTATGPDDPSVRAFQQALAAAPTMVMMSLATYTQLDPDAPAAFSEQVVGGLLRGQLGWDGVVISDSLTAAAVAGVPASERAVRFVEAGGDLSCFGDLAGGLAALDGLIQRARSDQAFAALVDASARRVLAAKATAGLAQ